MRMIEALWYDISPQEEELEVPQSHKDILDERERLICEGKAKFIIGKSRNSRSEQLFHEVGILDVAQNDLIEGCFFYQSKEHRLGDYFLDTLYSDIESLRIFGGIQRKAY